MSNYNKVVLMGRITRDPESKVVGQGTPLVNFGLAVNRRSKQGDKTMFVDVSFFGKQAGAVGHMLHKGQLVLVDGRLEMDSWKDKNTGGNRSKLYVVCEQLQMVDRAGPGGNGHGGGGQNAHGSYNHHEHNRQVERVEQRERGSYTARQNYDDQYAPPAKVPADQGGSAPADHWAEQRFDRR